MSSSNQINSPAATDANAPYPAPGTLDEDISHTAAATGALGAIKVAGVLVFGLLVWPPLAVIAFTIVVPFLVVALILGLLSTPYLLFHHLRGHHGGHLSLAAHRLRQAARALIDLAPHRIVADVRNVSADR
jgi:hypothetical protein